ncbi:DUF5343 domain-containing protein [Mesorhizobium sp. M7A.F.Ca.MR.245.00.0.0]|uniref:DUF5343 domain-containing protein n=1 Tax=Mesorhizobium sp. M7A.F.Ca.MR.245.00.0.0 TaxID=2496778 RepID=UPI000FCC6134|nr:DUF5343 domain-containing protein [Mesorhizobium sp. M7A.F.Ca.MR.245.00.0.0]RUV18024.1 hypothetical protein EOB80_24950 [Mesorhizobium sp. M7A.F.Ca.MR.245.00.0.0]RUV50737.1 hypothetical protein EOB77_13870 [Mesorhizobium sp. M7A.F.Ca.MR.228.00.0.0]
MPATLPYLSAPGSIKTAFEKIKAAATPERVTGDFVTTKLQLKGGTGAAMLPFLKRIGFVASDGSPTDLYKQFRNNMTDKSAVAAAIKHGYKPLSDANEYFYDLSDSALLSLILQVTGAAAEGQVPKLTLSTLKILKSYANFDTDDAPQIQHVPAKDVVPMEHIQSIRRSGLGLNLSYTINLNLPATSDQAVFNAIFKSLKEHLLSENE